KNPGEFIWARVLESAQQADSVLLFERQLTAEFSPDKKFAFEKRNNITIRQYSTEFTVAFNKKLNGMVERRMRQSILAIASFWYTAWVNAGQPDLKEMVSQKFSENELKEFNELNESWKNPAVKVREHEE
ncbi:MAG: S1/P1 Nuclease, partial [Chitinophagaceae bacterium]